MSDEPTKRYKIIYDRDGCIGAAACSAVAPEDWEIVADGKADLLQGKEEEEGSDIWVRYIDEEELQRNMDAAEACPVNVIKIIDTETGEQLYPE